MIMAELYPADLPKKTCSKCQQLLPLTHFYVSSTRLDKINPKCKRCCKRNPNIPVWEPSQIACPNCEKILWQSAHNQKYCARECATEYWRSSFTNRFRIFDRDHYRCVYCGLSSIEDGVVLNADHIVPNSKGGSETAGNLITSCAQCNSARGNRNHHPSVLSRLTKMISIRNKISNLIDSQRIKM